MFKLGGHPIFSINEEQPILIEQLFQRMLEEQNTDYHYKDDLIRTLVDEASWSKPKGLQFHTQRQDFLKAATA